ncbi:MAG: hypothetical protein HN742_32860 [Lentisphaerae bacterium]|jgi:hypothetical protein|nr:hypothetical protein [Lentisphaerota bacterium]MBT4821719.1 hypothetical protein [Lentisphaerota bacterium]MBT5610900.1 hypothetical protein [Lentisphaerota bacterium]MBT7055897.1 hypothetical protein [Lentisphaerota bacterium]MBT7846708.1 hypothetical protein [Lentisphaerota bacterium]
MLTYRSTLRLRGAVCCAILAMSAATADVAEEALVHLSFDGGLECTGELACTAAWQASSATVGKRDGRYADAFRLLSVSAEKEPGFEEGIHGQALRLTGRHMVELTGSKLVKASEGTVAFWFRPEWDSRTASTPPWRYHFLNAAVIDPASSKSEITGFRSVYFWMTPKSVFASFSRSKKKGKHYAVRPTWHDTHWNHVAFVWREGAPPEVWVNGQIGQQDGDMDRSPVAGADHLLIGRRNVTISDLSAPGLIDEFRLWGRALGQAEIQGLVAAERPEGGPVLETTDSRMPTGWLDIRAAFGAKGDGKTDDTDALQRAMDSRQVVFLSAGAYRFTKTLHLHRGTRLLGTSADAEPWNPFGQSTLQYDGPDGGIALLADRMKHVLLQDLAIDGRGKAGIGLKWINGFFAASRICGVQITDTTEHALYLAWMGVLTFDGLTIRRNAGNGITVGSHPNQDEGTGETNAVHFVNCGIIDNGGQSGYDGEQNVACGYGLGILGHCTSITVDRCTIEANGGPGVYLGANRKVCVMVRDSYFESNSRKVSERDRELHGPDFLETYEREPVGRKVSILIDSPHHRMSSIAFENVFIAGKRNGIWLRGTGPEEPILFRKIYKPNVIYAEHGSWEWIDSTPVTVAGVPGINVKDPTQAWTALNITNQLTNFIPLSKDPSGHPGISVKHGKRQVLPALPEGLDLFVDTVEGDDANDGRVPNRAWGAVDKVSKLLDGVVLDTPLTVHIQGETPVAMGLRNITGVGVLRIECGAEVELTALRLIGVTCRLEVAGAGEAQVGPVVVDRCPAVAFSRVALLGTDTNAAVTCRGSSGVRLRDCSITGHERGDGVVAEMSRVWIGGGAISGTAADHGAIATFGGTIALAGVRNECGVSERGGSVKVHKAETSTGKKP